MVWTERYDVHLQVTDDVELKRKAQSWLPGFKQCLSITLQALLLVPDGLTAGSKVALAQALTSLQQDPA